MLYLVLALVAVVSAKPAHIDPLSEESIDYINTVAKTWKAGKNFAEGWTLQDIEGLCGALKSPERILEGKLRLMKQLIWTCKVFLCVIFALNIRVTISRLKVKNCRISVKRSMSN